MNTLIREINPEKFSDQELFEAAKMISEGKLVVMPTETVYGLGANALDPDACLSIFDAKMRPADNPLIVHVLSPADFEKYADVSGQVLLEELSRRFMPGPLTVILPKKDVISHAVTGGLDTVALRCPSHPVARALIRMSGKPIAAPSANRSGRPSPTIAQHVIDDMDGRVHMIIDSGACQVGLESTVIALCGDKITLLRPGFVTLEDLKEVTENVIVSPAVLSSLKEGEKAESPGMKYRHYAPEVPVTMVDGEEETVLKFLKEQLSKGYGVLCFEEDLDFLFDNKNEKHLISFGSKNDLLSQAGKLFDALRRFDAVTVPRIFARSTKKGELGLAISNRLLRACAFDILHLEK